MEHRVTKALSAIRNRGEELPGSSPSSQTSTPTRKRGREDDSEEEKKMSTERRDRKRRECQPRDREQYKRRLSSFRCISKWFGKPNKLSPPHCARFGWSNIGRDQLECEVCSAQLLIKTSIIDESSFSSSQTSHDQLDEVDARLIVGHREFCPWKDNASPLSFTTYPSSPLTISPAFFSRLSSLKIITQLPPPSPTFFILLEPYGNLEQFPSRIAPDVNPPPSLNTILYSMTGWEGGGEAVSLPKNTLQCSLCARTIGLWNYSSDQPVDEMQKRQENTVNNQSSTSVSSTNNLPHTAPIYVQTALDIIPSRSVSFSFGGQLWNLLTPEEIQERENKKREQEEEKRKRDEEQRRKEEEKKKKELDDQQRQKNTHKRGRDDMISSNGSQHDRDGGDAMEESQNEESSRKRLKTSEMDLLKSHAVIGKDGKPFFDPIREHRWFCPWVATPLPGWKQNADSFLASNRTLQGSSNPSISGQDALAYVRKLLNQNS